MSLSQWQDPVTPTIPTEFTATAKVLMSLDYNYGPFAYSQSSRAMRVDSAMRQSAFFPVNISYVWLYLPVWLHS